MAIEALACPSCASTLVKEIKAGTYFCDHCESLFKHVDRAQVSLTPAFCLCGNPIAVQCQLCGAGLCARCEAPTSPSSMMVAPSKGYGYRLSESYLYQLVRPSSVEGTVYDHEYTPLVMPSIKLFGANKVLSSLNHVCWDCLGLEMPDVANAIDQGMVCEDPFCLSSPVTQCKCCAAHYCALGVVPDAEIAALILTVAPNEGQAELHVDWPSGICWGCANEGSARMTDVIFSDFTMLEVSPIDRVLDPKRGRRKRLPIFRLAGAPRAPNGNLMQSRADRRRAVREWDAYRKELQPAFDRAVRVADALRERWRTEQFQHPCARSASLVHESVTFPKIYNHPYDDQSPRTYILVDDRGNALPALVPALSADS